MEPLEKVQKKTWIDKCKERWNIESNLDLWLIMSVFSISGMTILYERVPIFHYVGITATTPFWIKFFAWLFFVFPCYQINLIIFGSLLGQFRFFWEKEKKMVRFVLKIFSRKKQKSL